MMWSRVTEVMLGFWLVLSPFIFRHSLDQSAFWINDFSCGFSVIICALLSFWPSLQQVHLVIIGVALWLIGFGFFASPYPTPPALQNNIIIGWLLLMFAIILNEANLPPRSWEEYFSEAREVGEQTIKTGEK